MFDKKEFKIKNQQIKDCLLEKPLKVSDKFSLYFILLTFIGNLFVLMNEIIEINLTSKYIIYRLIPVLFLLLIIQYSINWLKYYKQWRKINKKYNLIKNQYYQYPVVLDFLYYYCDFLPYFNNKNIHIDSNIIKQLTHLVDIAKTIKNNDCFLENHEEKFQPELQKLLHKLRCFDINLIIDNKGFYLNQNKVAAYEPLVNRINHLMSKNTNSQLPTFNYDWINLKNIQEYEKLIVFVVKEDIFV